MGTTNVKIELDDSVKDNELFNKILSINISKMTIFKYGILNEDVPKKIKENDFDYLEGKIPFLYGLYSDFIKIDQNKIINIADGENAKRISETIGVGVGLYYSTKLLQINPNIIHKIPAPKTQKGKYLDFKVITLNKQYEIETKGTVNHYKKNSLLKDIQAKKHDSKNIACKYGVITLANKEEDKEPSKLVVCDDFENIKINKSQVFQSFLEYYKLFLSFILDSTYYNRLVSKMQKNKFTKDMIKVRKIKAVYKFEDKTYYGRYFDKRLILDVIADFYSKNIKLNSLFKLLTTNIGKKKYFLGIDQEVIELINSKNVKGLNEFSQEIVINENQNKTLIRDIDGVIFVSSKQGGDKQIEKNFNEDEVKKRLSYIIGFINNEPHECGAPCRSRDKEGKLCEKLTFREHCHFHRD